MDVSLVFVRVQIPNYISIGSAVLAQLTTQSLYFTTGSSFKIAPSHGGPEPPSNKGSLGSPESTTQTACGWFSRFCTAHGRASYTLQWGALSPFKTAPSQAGSETHIIQDSLGPFESIIQTASQLVQPFFAQLTAECHYTL